MQKPPQIIPAEGVYAGYIYVSSSEDPMLDSPMRPAVFSLGQARTFGDDYPLLIEAHVLEESFDKQVHETWMAMDFIRRIRSQHKFKSPEKLSAQIAKDCQSAKEILAKNASG